MSFQERQKTKNHSDQQGNHLKASVRYLVYSPLSGLQPGGVVVVTSSFSDSIVFAVHTRKTAFSNSTFFKSFHSGERFRNDPFSDRCSVDGSRIRNKTVLFSFENGVVWTGSERLSMISLTIQSVLIRKDQFNLLLVLFVHQICAPKSLNHSILTKKHIDSSVHHLKQGILKLLRKSM